MLKKIMVIMIVLSLFVTLFTACGSSNNSQNNEETNNEETNNEETNNEETNNEEINDDETNNEEMNENLSNENEEKAVIEGEVSFFTYRDDLVSSSYPEWIESFNEKYPDVVVELSTVKDFDNALRVKLSSGDVPDVFTVEGVRYSDDQRAEYMLPLDDEFPELVGNWIGNNSNINTDNEKTYALTFGLQGIGLAYNKIIFNELGLEAPTTYDEMIEYAHKIKESGKIGLVGCLAPQWTLMPYSDTAQVIMEDQLATLNEMAESDEPFTEDNEFVKMMELVAQIRDEDVWEEDPLSYDWETYLRDFGSGKSGMAFTWTDTPMAFPGRGDGSLTIDDIGFVPFPYDNSGEYNVKFAPGWALAIAKDTNNLEAAKAFFEWHMQDIYGIYAKEAGMVSANKNVEVDIPYMKELESTNHEKVTMAKYPEKFKAIMDKAQIDFWHQYAEVAAGESPEDIASNMNDSWKKAKSIVE